MSQEFCQYLPDGITFRSSRAVNVRTLYAPLCGIDATALKSAISPCLSGDIKIDKTHYVTQPASREDLRRGLRHFFVRIDKRVFSLTEDSGDSAAHVEVGQLWHKLVRRYRKAGLELTAVNFIPVSGEPVELMRVTVKNTGKKPLKISPTAAIPLFGRALANKHDHEHVTALLHRIRQIPSGVLVEPTMIFNEEGHKPNSTVYFVCAGSEGEQPLGTFPTVESFCGEGGSLVAPEAVLKNRRPSALPPEELNGKEAVGAVRFKDSVLKAGAHKDYVMVIGAALAGQDPVEILGKFTSKEEFNRALQKNRDHWFDKTHSIRFQTGDKDFNSWLQWVTLQPILRRIFGCSFLPDHDYGKGGKGWRDLWQDLLSLILIEPENVQATLFNNFAGVRIDGSNATIIGSRPGEFIADRNSITRVWMDHGAWPLLTLKFYINRTGDYDFLLKEQTYFRDPQQSRTFRKDASWTPEYGNHLKTRHGDIYSGTILEHLLIQNLVQFFNVGQHNLIRLESADWNDGLDMAFERGESAAFTGFYGGNLLTLADLLENLAAQKGIGEIHVAQEMLTLLDTLEASPCRYDDVEEKQLRLFETYFKAVEPEVSGEKVKLQIKDVAADLRKKGQWIFDHLRKNEKISVRDGAQEYTWFNGYYDNRGERVEGKQDSRVRMTLTGQVFSIMSGLADGGEIRETVKSVRRYLQDKKLGGYRLNTDFGVDHYLELGRAFGFAYGTKENGAFFSHMTVMYAYGLYKRGFVREGYEVLQSIYKMCRDGERSKIYPGIPEYFDSNGRGMYHYLTGSASWLVLTELTQVFGVQGKSGDLFLCPKLVKEEFSAKGEAQVSFSFASRKVTVQYSNPQRLDYGKYRIKEILHDGKNVPVELLSSGEVLVKRKWLASLSGDPQLRVVLGT